MTLEDVFVEVTGLKAQAMKKGKSQKRKRQMKSLIAFGNIIRKDMKVYYLKPPNISWGLIFPLAWTAMFFIKSGAGLDSIPNLLPGVTAVSILFGTTSMLAVTVTFEKKNRSFERLLLAPIPLELLMLAKTGGAILFGSANRPDPDHHRLVSSPICPGWSGPPLSRPCCSSRPPRPLWVCSSPWP